MGVVYAKNTGEEIIVDDEFVPLLNRHNWHVRTWGQTKYAFCDIYRDRLWMHRLLLGGQPQFGGKLHIDHINHNGLDNRLENLRWACAASNAKNRRGRTPTSKYLGVSRTHWGKWRAGIGRGGKKRTLGYFDNEIEAAKSYDKAAFEYDGIKSWLNFPADYPGTFDFSAISHRNGSSND